MLRTCSEVGWIENERMEKRGAWKDARNWPDCPRKYGVAVQEDNPYGELRFEGASLPSVKSFDTTGNVPCTGRFSKIFCPGFRIGWIAGDKDIIRKYVLVGQTGNRPAIRWPR